MFPTLLELIQIFEMKKINSAKSIKKKEIFYGLFLFLKVDQV